MANPKVCTAKPALAMYRDMNAAISTGATGKFRRSTGEFQATFETPLKDLDRFAAAILSVDGKIHGADIIIEQIVFSPKNLNALFPGQKLLFGKDWSITATSREETHDLLRAALADWMDFAFIPTPKPFMIYADHDEYIKFFTHNKSSLNQIISTLSENKFNQVTDWKRHF